MIRPLLLLLLLLCVGAPAGFAEPPAVAAAPAAQATAAQTLSRTQAEAALAVLRDPARRAEMIAVLEAIARAGPAAPAAATPAAATPTAATPTAATPAAPAHLALPLTPDSLGAQVLTSASNRLSQLVADLVGNARAVADFPVLGHWLIGLATNPDQQQQLLDTFWRVLVLLAVGLGLEWGVRRALRRPANALSAAAPAGELEGVPPGEEGLAEAEAGQSERLSRLRSGLLILRRLPFAFGSFLLELLPVLTLLATGYVLAASTLADSYTTKLVMLGVLHAIVACRLAVALLRLVANPECVRLRLLPLSDDAAAYLLRWTRRLVVLTVVGYTGAEIGLLFGLYRVAYDAVLRIVAFAILLCLITIVLQLRKPVAARIRADAQKSGVLAMVRNRLAAAWHAIAIFYLLALWLVWALAVPNGFSKLLQTVLSAAVVAVVARAAVLAATGMLDRALRIPPDIQARHPGLEERLRSYQPVARALIVTVVAGCALVALFAAWGFDSLAWFSAGALGGRIVGALGSIATTVFLGLAVWEATNAAFSLHLTRLSRDGQFARLARLRTLLPMLRTTLLVSICAVAGLMVLSEVGVNIAPLLAGAGVVGIAIGFGSQKLVQDVITGLFLLLENTMQVGDSVTLGGLSGTVEALSVRTIRLRALDGSVHMVPFSAVTTVTNQTRDFGYAVIDVSVHYTESPDHVSELLRGIGREMRAEPKWGAVMLEDLEIWGVDRFLDTAFVLRGRVKTAPGEQWGVGRELNRRIKMAFDANAIGSPWTSWNVLGVPPPVLMVPRTDTAPRA
jgi:small-conductance mechanosensitive channel